MIIIDNLVALGLAAAKDFAKEKIDEIKLKNDLKDFIEKQKKYNEICSLAEEFDFQGRIEYIFNNLISDVKARFFAVSSKDREFAQKSIVTAAVEHSGADTDAARGRVARLVAMCLEIIRDAFRKKIPLQEYYLAAEIVEGVKENTDEVVNSAGKEINQNISDSTTKIMERLDSLEKHILAEGNLSQDQAAAVLDSIDNDQGLKIVDAETVNEISEEDLEDFPESSLQYMRDALGKNAIGLNKVQLMARFLNTTDAILQNDLRYDVPKYILDFPRSRWEAYFYVDDLAEPVDCGNVTEFYWNEYNKFIYNSAHFQVEILYKDGRLFDFSIGFEVLDKYVVERLDAFETVKKVLTAGKGNVVLDDVRHRALEIPIGEPKEMWEGKKEALFLCDFWCARIQQMRVIEEFYDIVFELKVLIGEENIQDLYTAVNYVYNGIVLQANCEMTLPRKTNTDFEITAPMLLEEDEELPLPIQVIHNYCFAPYQSWLLPGTILMEGTTSGDDIKTPGCCRYKVLEEDLNQVEWNNNNYEPTQISSHKVIEHEISDKEVELLGKEEAEFICYYMRFVYGFEEIWRRFSKYKEKLDSFIIFFLGKDDQYKQIDIETGKLDERITINNLANSVVIAGEKLIDKINSFAEFTLLEKESQNRNFSMRWESESLGYYFLRVMKQFTYFGCFPIRLTEKREGYYDINELENIVQAAGDTDIIRLIGMFKEIFMERGIDLSRIELYGIMRNAIYGIAHVNKKYYMALQTEIENVVNRMDEILAIHKNLIFQKGEYSTDIVYKYDGKYYSCPYVNTGGILEEYSKYRNSAEEELEICLEGMNETGD